MPAEPLGLTSQALHDLIAGELIPLSTWRDPDVSGADILRILQNVGMGIRESDFYEIWRSKTGLVDHELGVTNLPQDERVPRNWIDPVDWALSKNFLYQTRVFGIDPETGEQIDKYISISSMTEMTNTEVQAEVLDKTLGQAEFYGIEVSGCQLFHAYSVRDVWDRL